MDSCDCRVPSQMMRPVEQMEVKSRVSSRSCARITAVAPVLLGFHVIRQNQVTRLPKVGRNAQHDGRGLVHALQRVVNVEVLHWATVAILHQDANSSSGMLLMMRIIRVLCERLRTACTGDNYLRYGSWMRHHTAWAAAMVVLACPRCSLYGGVRV